MPAEAGGALGPFGCDFAEGGPDRVIDAAEAESLLSTLLERLGPLRRVLLVPPDFTRVHSGAGALTSWLFRQLAQRSHVEVLPALGTHRPMSADELERMFPGIPAEAFRIHDFRRDVVQLGEVPAAFVREVSGGLLDTPIRCEVATALARGGWDRVISIGQVVPHEVAGFAGHAKNIFVGAGGKDAIDKTHFLGAVCGMEAAMGRAETPVRRVLSFMAREFGAALPITHLLTVRGRTDTGALVTRGLFAGDDERCFFAAARLAATTNITLLHEAPRKVVVALDPREYRSTWLGNKAIYRTRLAIADGAELLIIAPGVHCFGEDATLDRLIARHGYHGTQRTLAAVEQHGELQASLAAAAHLIHGASEGRFSVHYATGGIDDATLRSVGYTPASLASALERYPVARLHDGWNDLPDGERIFFVSNPALGLWSQATKFTRT